MRQVRDDHTVIIFLFVSCGNVVFAKFSRFVQINAVRPNTLVYRHGRKQTISVMLLFVFPKPTVLSVHRTCRYNYNTPSGCNWHHIPWLMGSQKKRTRSSSHNAVFPTHIWNFLPSGIELLCDEAADSRIKYVKMGVQHSSSWYFVIYCFFFFTKSTSWVRSIF